MAKGYELTIKIDELRVTNNELRVKGKLLTVIHFKYSSLAKRISAFSISSSGRLRAISNNTNSLQPILLHHKAKQASTTNPPSSVIRKVDYNRIFHSSPLFEINALIISITSIKFTLSHSLTPSGVCKWNGKVAISL